MTRLLGVNLPALFGIHCVDVSEPDPMVVMIRIFDLRRGADSELFYRYSQGLTGCAWKHLFRCNGLGRSQAVAAGGSLTSPAPSEVSVPTCYLLVGRFP